MHDQAIRFSFDKLAIRGAYVSLQDSISKACATNSYPEGVALLLAQFMAASAVIGELTQFDGLMTLQVRSDQALGLIMSEHHHNGNMRAIAQNYDQVKSTDFNKLLGNGIMTLTLDPSVGKRYQGIIQLIEASVAGSLSHYFKQSEQLNTHIVIRHTNTGVAALMLQAIPDSDHSQLSDDEWFTITRLADTLRSEEANSLEQTNILYRLFHEFDVRVQPPRKLQYFCNCSKQRISKALKTVSETELRGFLAQGKQLEVNCDFCNKSYDFNAADLDTIFGTTGTNNETTTTTDAKLH